MKLAMCIRTVLALTLMLTAGCKGRRAGETSAYTHQIVDMCRPCHGRQVAQWSASMHARAHTDSVYNRYFIKASQESGRRLETFCARCHTPLGVLRGEIPFARAPRRPADTRVSAVATEGVQCDFCHTIAGYDRLENGGYRLAAARVMRGPLKDARSPMHGTAYDPLFRRSELCGTCHNVTHPQNGIVLESTFSEWRASPHARRGVSCQDCHMTAGLTRRIVRPGQAGHGGPPRPHIADHFFVGPNLIYSSRDDSAQGRELRRLSAELLRRAARLEIGEPVQRGERIAVPITVRNVGAGHGLPTGVTELRQIWLDVAVKDARGREVLRSGALDARGELGAETIIFRTEVFDAAGRLTTKFWNTVRKGRDHRVPAGGSVTEHVPLPDGVAWPLKIEAALKYRSVAPSGLAEVDAPRDLVAIPVITMTAASRTL